MAVPATPDAQWLWANEPCRAACPVHTDAGAYVTAIAEGRFEDAYLIARAPNPFPSVCGRVCAAPCEQACRRGSVDAPVSIRALKRFVTERFGVESFAANTMWHAAHGEVPPATGPSVGVKSDVVDCARPAWPEGFPAKGGGASRTAQDSGIIPALEI